MGAYFASGEESRSLTTMDRCNGGTSNAAPPSSTPSAGTNPSTNATTNNSNSNNGGTTTAAAAGVSNNGVKLRPVSSVDSVAAATTQPSTTGVTASAVGGAYRRSFHRSGPGSASATSDYSMSTLAESVQDDLMCSTSSTPTHPHLNGSSGPLLHGHGGHHLHLHGGLHHGHRLLLDGHNTPGLPGSNLTQAGLEEYSRSYYEQTMYHHQK